MGVTHIKDVIGDPEVFVQHMIRDAMRGAKDNLPLEDKPMEQLNHEEYIRQWEEENNKRCKHGQHGNPKASMNSSETESEPKQNSSDTHSDSPRASGVF